MAAWPRASAAASDPLWLEALDLLGICHVDGRPLAAMNETADADTLADERRGIELLSAEDL